MTIPASSASAEALVQRQLDAYNAKDIDAFIACWADDCAYYLFPDQLLARGAAAVRERHLQRFKEANLHGKLVSRMAVGDLVIDQERVTRTFPEGTGEIDVIAMYQVVQGKIAQAWFKMGEPELHARG